MQTVRWEGQQPSVGDRWGHQPTFPGTSICLTACAWNVHWDACTEDQGGCPHASFCEDQMRAGFSTLCPFFLKAESLSSHIEILCMISSWKPKSSAPKISLNAKALFLETNSFEELEPSIYQSPQCEPLQSPLSPFLRAALIEGEYQDCEDTGWRTNHPALEN